MEIGVMGDFVCFFRCNQCGKLLIFTSESYDDWMDIEEFKCEACGVKDRRSMLHRDYQYIDAAIKNGDEKVLNQICGKWSNVNFEEDSVTILSSQLAWGKEVDVYEDAMHSSYDILDTPLKNVIEDDALELYRKYFDSNARSFDDFYKGEGFKYAVDEFFSAYGSECRNIYYVSEAFIQWYFRYLHEEGA